MKIVIIEPLGITEDKQSTALAPLRARGHEITAYTTRTEDVTELRQRGEGADIIIVANLPLKRDVLSACKNLKLLSVAFTGVDHIDIDYCKEKGIAVSNAAGYSTHAVAELSFGLTISVLRNLPACDIRCREGGTKAGLVGSELYGKTFGIIGTGAIGGEVAKIAQAFGCHVVAYSRSERENMKSLGVIYLPLEEVIKTSDILSLHIPLNAHTQGLMNEERLRLMKPTAILINAARGGVVDSQALAQALNEERIAGAGIDVFEDEPPIALDHPLLHSKNTVVAPHVAFASHEALFTRAQIVSANIEKWEDGQAQNVIC